MRLYIRHETTYAYHAPLTHSVQRLCLTPRSFESQKTHSWTIQAPGFRNGFSHVDCFGNIIHMITATSVKGPFSIIAEGTVECHDSAGVVRGITSQVADGVFLRQTAATAPSAAMIEWLAENDLGQTSDPLQTLHSLSDRIHQKVTYVLGATDSETTAAQAFADNQGVCQDHAHIFIGLARQIGIPSRYVTGYLITGTGASSTASHAWAEALIPDLGWVGFDPANNKSPTEHYVRVAMGIEAANISPVRGSRRGGGAKETMDVAVRVEIAQQ